MSSKSSGGKAGSTAGAEPKHEPTSLVSFFIFSRPLGSDDEAASLEEVAEKVLFFHPPNSSLQQQLQRISLCEGMIDFTSKFSPEQPVHAVHMLEHHYTFVLCEPETWMVMVLRRADGGDPTRGGGALQQPDSRERIYDSQGTVSVDDTALRAAMLDAYSMFTMFHGTLHDCLYSGRAGPRDGVERLKVLRKQVRKAELLKLMIERGDVTPGPAEEAKLAAAPGAKRELDALTARSPAAALRRRLQRFLPQYLSVVDFGHIHLFYDLDGFHFFPVDRAAYLSVQYFVSMLHARFASHVAGMAFLFDGHVVWSNVDQPSMRLVYKFLRIREQEATQRARAARAAAKRAAAERARRAKARAKGGAAGAGGEGDGGGGGGAQRGG
eukprot:g6291.t1